MHKALLIRKPYNTQYVTSIKHNVIKLSKLQTDTAFRFKKKTNGKTVSGYQNIFKYQ